jgi:hypothetical protein
MANGQDDRSSGEGAPSPIPARSIRIGTTPNGVEWICHRCPNESDDELLQRAEVMDRAFRQVCAAKRFLGSSES